MPSILGCACRDNFLSKSEPDSWPRTDFPWHVLPSFCHAHVRGDCPPLFSWYGVELEQRWGGGSRPPSPSILSLLDWQGLSLFPPFLFPTVATTEAFTALVVCGSVAGAPDCLGLLQASWWQDCPDTLRGSPLLYFYFYFYFLQQFLRTLPPL